MATQAQIKQFFDRYSTLFIRTSGSLLPSVKAAQAALESAYGTSAAMAKANAFFGIKAAGNHTPYWNGKAYNTATKEVINGSTVGITAAFRAYDTLEQGSLDHTYFLEHTARYRNVLFARTYQEQCRQLQACGYATATNYANSLINLIEKYKLYQLDAKKKMNKIVITTGCSLCILFMAFIIYKQYA